VVGVADPISSGDDDRTFVVDQPMFDRTLGTCEILLLWNESLLRQMLEAGLADGYAVAALIAEADQIDARIGAARVRFADLRVDQRPPP
jgi:hypothetical protein